MPSSSTLAHLALSHLLSVVSVVFAILLVAQSVGQRRATGSTVAWLLAILFIPYLGIPLYLLLGSRKLRAEAGRPRPASAQPSTKSTDINPIARMLCAAGACPPTPGNRVELLPTGEQSFAAVIAAIRSAERTIDISTLIFAADEVGAAIAAELITKARRGVRVRLLIDAMFEFRSNRKQIGALRDAGVLVVWFMPVGRISRHGSVNLRLHRKAIVVDEDVAIVGGMNLASEYMGPTPLPGRWRDLSARVTGAAVGDVARIFQADWSLAADDTPEPSPVQERSPATEVEGDVTIQVVGSGPDVESDLIYDAVLSAVFTAKHRLWIVTPYFVPDEALVRGIILAVRRGVDVCVVVPLRSNHLTADLAGGPYLRDLQQRGARIRCYEPGMLHAKLVLVDDDLCVLGSANMDMRSFFLNYEIALFIDSKAKVDETAELITELLSSSIDLPTRGRARRLVESVARLLAPLE